jgi:hypothetical protein
MVRSETYTVPSISRVEPSLEIDEENGCLG